MDEKPFAIKVMRKATVEDMFGITATLKTADMCSKDTDFQRQVNHEFGAKKFIKP